MNRVFLKSTRKLKILSFIILQLVLIIGVMYGYSIYGLANGINTVALGETGATNVQVTGVKLTRTTMPLYVGQRSKASAIVAPYGATNKAVTWQTSDASVAVVDATGYVTAKAAGKATVTATTVDGAYTAACEVTVTTVSVTGITLSKSALSLIVGRKTRLWTRITPYYVTNKNVIWKSSNELVAKVDEKGYITALTEGTTTITVTTVDGSYSANCEVTVNSIHVTGVKLYKTTLSLIVGRTAKLGVKITPYNAINKSVIWKSSNESVAKVDGKGYVTAVAEGTSKITVISIDGSYTAECEVTVKNITVTRIYFYRTSLILNAGKSYLLKVSVAPYNAVNKSVTYSSSDAKVATVDAAGKITAMAAGKATITATSVDGGKTATCVVTVNGTIEPVTGTNPGKTTLTLNIGSKETLILPVSSTDIAGKVVTYTSSDNTVATVDENGGVTAIAAGTVTITATTADGSYTTTYEVKVPETTGTGADTSTGTNTDTNTNTNTDPSTNTGTNTDTSTDTNTGTDTSTGTNTNTLDSPAIFYIPHTWDETIYMAPSILEHVRAGRKVLLVLLTDGAASFVKDDLNGIDANNTIHVCPLHGRIHNPLTEGYKDGTVDKAEFVAARIREFKAAAAAMGIPAENVFIQNFADGTLTVEQVKSVITSFEQKYPKASHKVMTGRKDLDDHPDHYACGQAASELYNSRVISDVRFYVRSDYWNAAGTLPLMSVTATISDATKLQAAISAYKTWVPNQGEYAIGYHSNKPLFDELSINKTSKYYAPETVLVTGVSFDVTGFYLNIGTSRTLTVSVEPSNALNKALTFTSSNNAIAVVDNTGKVTGMSAGNATITVKTADGGLTATCVVTVTVPVTGVTLNKTKLTLNTLESETLIATVLPSNASNKDVIFTSNNYRVASVDGNGKVTGVSGGNATITVETVDGGKTATCEVTIIQPVVPVTGVRLYDTTLLLSVGSTKILFATVEPYEATNQAITFRSSNSAVATVNDYGEVTGVSAGTATITVVTVDGGKTATCEVTVFVSVTGVRLDKTTLALNVGDKNTLTATVEPSNAANKAVMFVSSNESVATVDANGVVTAVSEGKATITAISDDNYRTATCEVTVYGPAEIFYIPHTWDETIYMGPSIIERVNSGKRVILVLLTDGAASFVKDDLNGIDANNTIHVCPLHGRIHNPLTEGYKDGTVDKAEFVAARIREFKAAAAAMGIPAENVFIQNFADGTLTVEQVKSVISSFEQKYPKASHNVITYRKDLDDHSDHYNSGQAALELYNAGTISKAKFYVRSSYWNAAGTLPMISVSATASDITELQAAISAYKTWVPSQGEYAIGYHSNKSEFDTLSQNATSKYHALGIQ